MTALDSDFLMPSSTFLVVLVVVALLGLLVMSVIGGVIWIVVRRANRPTVGPAYDEPVR
jgi:hypothetical protein